MSRTMMTALDQGIATETTGNDLTAHQLFAWGLFLINALMIVITYLHVPVADLYHVSEGGFTGGLGRVLVYTNFPTSLAALALIGLAVRRIRRSGMLKTNRARHTVSTIGIVAAALCLVTAVPGVVENGDLDAKPVNVIPAIGVLIALGLTIVSFRFRERYRPLPWSNRDRIGLVIIAMLTAISLPWILADLGVYIGDVPLIGRIVMSEEIAEGGTLPAVHLGHHHGLDGWLLVVTALTLGRLVEALDPAPAPANAADPDYLSGRSGTLGRRTALVGALKDAWAGMRPRRWANRPPGGVMRLLRPSATRSPRRRVHVVGVARPENLRTVARLRRELGRSHHDVALHLAAPAAGAGKWANINAALAAAPLGDADWLLLVDDDVILPRGFLDRFLALAEGYGFELAQPAHAFASHAAWDVTRRRPGVLARRTRFVEIGPITAISAKAARELLPFPDLRMGWGLDGRWSAIAADHGWPIGIVDATPIRHLKPVASSYPRDEAIAEAEAFLDGRAYVTRDEAHETLAEYRRWPA
jgi:hypothetical protein